MRDNVAPDDEGQLRFQVQVRIQAGQVVIDFGNEIRSLAMPPDVARLLARMLTGAADEMEKRT